MNLVWKLKSEINSDESTSPGTQPVRFQGRELFFIGKGRLTTFRLKFGMMPTFLQLAHDAYILGKFLYEDYMSRRYVALLPLFCGVKTTERICKETMETYGHDRERCWDILAGHEKKLSEALKSNSGHWDTKWCRLLRQGGELLAMQDPDRMAIKVSQWRQEDQLIELLHLGQLNAGRSSGRTGSLRLDAARDRAISKFARARVKAPDVFEEPKIDCSLQDAHVSAFPDTGAAANFVSLQYAQQRGITIDKNLRERVKVGDGSTIRIVGTTTLPFSFVGETTTHDLTFHVLRKSVHDVILGSAFLQASETFTRFAHRVGRKIRESVGRGVHRLCFLESQQFVNGMANGVAVDAVPDTGADVSVMSAKFAKANGFEIDDAEQDRILLGFADGSTARARGVVKNVEWRFGGDGQAHLTDVYVLSNLPVDIVLGYDFLCQTEAFREHEQDFWYVEDLEGKDDWMLCVIRVLRKAMEDAGGENTREYHCRAMCEQPKSDSIAANAAEERWQLAKACEIALYRKARKEAQELGLSDDETRQHLQPHVARWQQFLATRPDHGLDIVNTTPPPSTSGSAASSQTGGVHLQVRPNVHATNGSIEMGKFSMGWFRRKARRKSSVATPVRT